MEEILWKFDTENSQHTDTNNGKTFMNKDGIFSNIAARPIRTAMAKCFGAGDGMRSVVGWLFDAVDGKYSAHAEQVDVEI